MNYIELSPQAEKLLSEIIELSDNGKDNEEYWKQKLSPHSPEENQLRDAFKELKDCGYIYVRWADDIPYYINVMHDGKNYELYKKERELEEKRRKRRKWKIAIVPVLIGAAVGLVPWIISLF